MAYLEWQIRKVAPGPTQAAVVGNLKRYGWKIYTTTPDGRVFLRKRKPLPVEVEVDLKDSENHNP